MTDYLRLAQERAPQSLEPQDNPYLPLAQQAQALGQNRARTVIETALRDDPDIAAERQRLSRTSGVPLNVVERNLEELRIKERARAVDLVTLAQESPVLYRQIADPTFTTTSIDDLDTLKNIERTIGSGTAYAMGATPGGGLPSDVIGGVKTLGAAVPLGLGKMANDIFAFATDLIPGGDEAAGYFRRSAAQQEKTLKGIGFQGGTPTREAIKSGLESSGPNIALLPIGVWRSLYTTASQAAATVAGIMSAGVGASAFNQAREKGKNEAQALTYAIPEAAFEYVFERIPASKLFGDIAANTGLLKTIGKQTVSEGWTEQVTTLAQDFNEWMNLNPDKTIGQFIQERPEAAYQTFIATLVGVGVQTSTIKGINKVIEQASNQALSFEQDRLQQQMALASQSLLRQRSPEQFRAYVQQLDQGEIYVDAEVLNQLPQEVLAQLPETVREQIPAALNTNSTVAISKADVLTVASGTELEQILNDNARIRPNASSRVEAQLAAEMIQQEADRVLAQAADQTAWQQSTQVVQQTILDQLNATGRKSADVNQAYATLQAAFFSTMAARTGVTPEQFYQEFSLKVAASQQAGQVLNADLATLDQGDVEVTDQLDEITGLPLNADGTVTLYHHTSAANAEAIKSSKVLRSAGEPSVYLTTRDVPDTGYGDTVVKVRIDPAKLQLDDEFPDGRRDFSVDVGRPGGALRDAQFNQSATLRRGTETLKRFGLKPGGKYKTREVAAALEARQRAKYGTIAADDRSPEALANIAKWMTAEVEFEMSNPEKSGVGWYSEKFQRALDAMGEVFPELKTDKTARNTMTALIAITSDGQKVVPNFAQAMDIYGNFRDTGKFSTSRGHARQASIATNLEVIQRLHDTMGPEVMHEYLMQEKSISELKQIAKANGGEMKSDYQAHIKMPMAAVEFGPKLGAFYANLMGAHGYLTMDRWWSRTFNRYRGTLLQSNTQSALDSFKALIGKSDISNDEVLAEVVTPREALEARGFKTRLALLVGRSEPGKAADKARWMAEAKAKAGDQFDALLQEHKVERAANTIYKTAFENLEDSPFNATDRTFMLEAVNKSQQTLKRKGYNLSVADIQAILWYYEKRLYGELGARQTADISYEEAAQRVASSYASGQGIESLLDDTDTAPEDGGTDEGGVPVGEDQFVEEGVAGPAVYEQTAAPKSDYTLDLFGVPTEVGADTAAEGSAAGRPEGRLSRDDAPGRYATRTELVEENTRKLGTDNVTSVEEAAQAMAYLGRAAVERFDALITDAGGKPLAIVGAFKGALSQASVFPATIAAEAFRVNGAAHIWFAHNHPSGNPDLSSADLRLNENLAEVFRGSEIQTHGIFAIAGREGDGRKWKFATAGGSQSSGVTTAPAAEADVPVVERVFAEDAKLGPPIVSPTAAKQLSTALSQGGSGVLLMDAQHTPLAFVPIEPAVAGELRTQGRMDAMWRALSISNAGAAIIVNQGDMTEKQVKNLAGFLTSSDTRVLDVMDSSTGSLQSWAENGREFKSTTFNQGPRGTFNPQALLISLNENADLSTFLHESGHFFLEVMADLASRDNAPQQIKDDMAATLKWFGVPDLATWNGYTLDQKRQYHERWAESFEQYLFEGKAPNIELQPLFRRFRSFMVAVYKSLTQFMRGRDLKVSDEIRAVFDRMIATDEQIAQAEQAAGMLPDFEATNEAIETLQARSLRDLKWTINARSKYIKKLTKEAKDLRKAVEAEVRAEVELEPIYRAMNWLRKGETVDPETGDTIKAEKGFRLSTEGLAELFPETMLGRPDLTRLKGMTAKEGLHPNLVADMFGFESGEALVRNILDAEPIASVVEGKTDQRMIERHGDLATPEAIEAAANEAVHNEARARSLATELKSQSEMMNQRQDTGRTASNGRAITVNAITQAAKEFALNLAARRRIKDLKNAAWQHRAAEARAGKRWQQLTAEGKTQEAVQAKRDQLLNNYAAKALQDAQAEVKKTLEFFKRVVTGNDEKIVERGRDPDVVNAMRAILGAYDIAPRLEKSALAYMETVSKNDPATYAALQPSVTAALVNAKPFSELTLEELRGLTEELRAMWALAKRSRQMEVDGDLIDIQDAADELMARMDAIGIPDQVPGEKGAITDREEAGIKLQFAKSILRRVEQWAEGLDGKFGGPFLRLVFQPIKDAADRYRTAKVEYRQQFTDLVKGIAPLLPPGPVAAPEIGYTFGNARDSGMAELLHAILHTGNDSNKRKLLLGRGWASENADGTLDTSRWDAFIQRLITEGKLRKEHYDFAQGVWDLLEQTKPLAQETHRKVFGRYFAEVTANEVVTPFGTYRGGYVPAQTDSRLVKDAKLRELAEAENESMAYAFPASPSGFTKSRVEYNKPLLLDLRTLGQHLDKVLLFSHMQGAVTDVRRLLTRKDVSYALDRIDPGAYEGMLIPWLNRAAKQVVETPVVGDRKLSRFLSGARSRAGMALMFANLSNTVQQITGFSLAAVKVKPALMMKATGQFIADPKAMKTSVAQASPYMKDRMLNEVGAMNDAVEQILIDPSLLEKSQAWTQRHAYFLQAAVDNTMSPIIWTAAYNQAVEEGQEHKDAVRFADGVVRQTQGSLLPEDISRFESGHGYARLFTQFVSYFNMMANTNATAVKQIVDEMGLKKGAGRLLYIALAGMLVPIWVAEAIAQAFRGGPDDEDKDGWLDDWLMAVFGMGTLRGLVAQVPILGQAAQLVVNRFNDNPADDKFSLSPAVSLIESAASSPASVYKAIVDDGNKQKAVRDVFAAATLLTGLPFFAVARPVGYLAGVADDRIEPTGPIDFARGLVTGTASPESKVP